MSSGFGCLFCNIMIIWMCGTKLVQVCEGTVRYLVGWSKIVTLLCVMALMNNMQCVRILLMHAN